MAEKEKAKEVSQPKEVLYNVIFRDNRSFELTVGREFLRFEPHVTNPVVPEKYKNGVPESIISHPDFKIKKDYFNIFKQGDK